MLEQLDGLPTRVVGIEAKGEVTAHDYQTVLVPAVEEKLAQFKRVRLLYVLGDEFTGFTGAAAWEDAKVGMRHFTDFERIAVVSNTEWVRHMVRAFGFAIPGEVRVYAGDDLDQARAWVAEPPSRGSLEFKLMEDERVLLLEPKDELEAGDFERVAAEIDPFIDRAGGLAGLMIVAEEFPGWDDFAAFIAHFRFVREHHGRIRRVALVTSSRFLSALPRLAGRFVDAEVKQYPLNERAAALSWVSGKD